MHDEDQHEKIRKEGVEAPTSSTATEQAAMTISVMPEKDAAPCENVQAPQDGLSEADSAGREASSAMRAPQSGSCKSGAASGTQKSVGDRAGMSKVAGVEASVASDAEDRSGNALVK